MQIAIKKKNIIMKKVKKQCGYLDNKGFFHKTEFACSNSNLDIKIDNLQREISNMRDRYLVKMRRDGYLIENVVDGHYQPSEIFDILLRHIFRYELDDILEFKKQIELLEKEVELLFKLRNSPKVLRRDWWLNRVNPYLNKTVL